MTEWPFRIKVEVCFIDSLGLDVVCKKALLGLPDRAVKTARSKNCIGLIVNTGTWGLISVSLYTIR